MKTKADVEKMLKIAVKRSNQAILSAGKAVTSLDKREVAACIIAASTTVNVLRMVLSEEEFDKEEQVYFLSVCG